MISAIEYGIASCHQHLIKSTGSSLLTYSYHSVIAHLLDSAIDLHLTIELTQASSNKTFPVVNMRLALHRRAKIDFICGPEIVFLSWSTSCHTTKLLLIIHF